MSMRPPAPRRAATNAAALAVVAALALTACTSTPAPSPAPATPFSAAPEGWRTVVAEGAGLRWDVPPDWVVADVTETVESSDGVRIAHLADYGPYTCQGAEYGHALAGGGALPTPGGTPGEAAADLAAAIAADHYSDAEQTARVTVSRPTPVVRDGVTGALVRADARVSEGADPCAGRSGAVTVVVLGGGVFVLAADTETGPEQPGPLLDDATARAIADTVRPIG